MNKEQNEKAVPPVGAIVREVGGELTYRVVSRIVTDASGSCAVECTVTEAVPAQTYGIRQPRRLTYTERHRSLFLSRTDGRMVEGKTYRTWEVVA